MTARILIIAGSDSGGGAGIQADIKTVTMLGGHAMTAITAITAQNTRTVENVLKVPTELVVQQMATVAEDIGVDAIKIGMLGGPNMAAAVADELASGLYPRSIVFDPVMVATSGATLADDLTVQSMDRLARISTIVTPNLPELAALCGQGKIADDDVEAAAALYAARIGTAVLVKGGHGGTDVITDCLIEADGTVTSWSDPRINTTSTHGTGCTLATAIAAGLGQGMALTDAIDRARRFVRLALRDAPGLGSGHGPLGHQLLREDAMVDGPSLNQITLGSRDYRASVDFYTALGLRQIVDCPSNGYARFEAPNGVTLSIHAADDIATSATIYFESKRLDAWVHELASDGFAFEQLPQDQDWGWREARLLDPSGNMICLYSAGENRRYPAWRI
jgi:hydroxymethylpyrimidine/phosphomethylpyrimidine kinase